jgi:hypothetical protein
MKTDSITTKAREFATPFRVTDGKKFQLKDYDPGDTLTFGA